MGTLVDACTLLPKQHPHSTLPLLLRLPSQCCQRGLLGHGQLYLFPNLPSALHYQGPNVLITAPALSLSLMPTGPRPHYVSLFLSDMWGPPLVQSGSPGIYPASIWAMEILSEWERETL